MSDFIESAKAPEAVGPYPHARRVGDFVFVSGTGPRQRGSSEIPGVTFDNEAAKLPGDRIVKSYDVALQTRACIENIRVILSEAGLKLSDIVDVQVYLTDIKKDFASFNKVYAEYFRAADGPTRTTIGVTGLPTPIHVEIKVVAWAGQNVLLRD
jgi:2-aminomuconate deaminase